MKDYEKIQRARSDFTVELVHMTKDFRTLVKIVCTGRLDAGLARRKRQREGGVEEYPTIKGPRPAVCFSEMPLTQVLALHRAWLFNRRYEPFGVAIPKKLLFREAKALPVIYSDRSILGDKVSEEHPAHIPGHEVYDGGLGPELQHRYVPLDLEGDNPIDWTHEREWRALPVRPDEYGWEGVPLQLGVWGKADPQPRFRLFVLTGDDRERLRRMADAVIESELPAAKNYRETYLKALRTAEIVALRDL